MQQINFPQRPDFTRCKNIESNTLCYDLDEVKNDPKLYEFVVKSLVRASFDKVTGNNEYNLTEEIPTLVTKTTKLEIP